MVYRYSIIQLGDQNTGKTTTIKKLIDYYLKLKEGSGSRDHASLNHASLDHASLNHASLDHASLDHASLNHASLNHESDKTKIKPVFTNEISLFHENIIFGLENSDSNLEVADSNLEVAFTIWDANHKVKDFNHFISTDQITTCLIYCNLQDPNSVNRIDYWKKFIIKYIPKIKIIIVGTYFCNKNNKLKINDLLKQNKIKILKWCVKNGDIPFFSFELSKHHKIYEMFQSIIFASLNI